MDDLIPIEDAPTGVIVESRRPRSTEDIDVFVGITFDIGIYFEFSQCRGDTRDLTFRV